MPEPANTSPSQTSQSQQSSPLPEAQETQETPKTQGSQPTHEPSAHQEEQPLAKPKITREEIAQRPLNKRAVITIGAAFLITFAFDRLICSIPPTWLIGYELPVFWIICALTVTALHWKTARKQVLVWLVLGSIVAIGVWNTLAQSTWCYSRNDEYALTTQFVQRALRCSPSTSGCLELAYRLVAAAVYSHSRFCGTVFRHIRKICSRVEATFESARNRHCATDFHSIASDDRTIAHRSRSNSSI